MWRRANTRQDWARWIEGMLERRYPEAERVVLVMDNLNTHGIESLYATTSPDTLANWRNDSKSITRRNCGNRNAVRTMPRRIPMAQMQREIEAWVGDRNQRQTEINWQFKTEDARIKLRACIRNFKC